MKYRIWSNCQCAWWRSNGAGYTRDVSESGIYPEDKARSIHRARSHRSGCGCDQRTVADVAIPAPDHSRATVVTAPPPARESNPWRPVDHPPTLDHADENGDVEYLRSDRPMPGRVPPLGQIPVDATHWRFTERYMADKGRTRP